MPLRGGVMSMTSGSFLIFSAGLAVTLGWAVCCGFGHYAVDVAAVFAVDHHEKANGLSLQLV